MIFLHIPLLLNTCLSLVAGFDGWKSTVPFLQTSYPASGKASLTLLLSATATRPHHAPTVMNIYSGSDLVGYAPNQQVVTRVQRWVTRVHYRRHKKIFGISGIFLVPKIDFMSVEPVS